MSSIFKAIYKTPSKEDKKKGRLELSAKAATVAGSIDKLIMALEPIEAQTIKVEVLQAKAIEPKPVEIEASVPREAKTNPLREGEQGIEFDFKYYGGGELNTKEVAKLKSYALTPGYRICSIILSGGDRDELFCVPDENEARVVKKQTINGSLAYTNIKVKIIPSSSIFWIQTFRSKYFHLFFVFGK